MFPSYLERLLTSLKTQGISVALETSGYFNYDTFRRKILPNLDLIYYDLKFVDNRAHQEFTGRPNRTILQNLGRLIQDGNIRVLVRVPLVPGVTATEENLSSLIRYLRAVGADRVLPLPYNPLGMDKYPSLGLSAPDLPQRFMRPDEEERVREILAAAGCAVPS